MQPNRCSKIITACVLLNNFARKRNLPDPENVPIEDGMEDGDENGNVPPDTSSLEIRDNIAFQIASQ